MFGWGRLEMQSSPQGRRERGAEPRRLRGHDHETHVVVLDCSPDATHLTVYHMADGALDAERLAESAPSVVDPEGDIKGAAESLRPLLLAAKAGLKGRSAKGVRVLVKGRGGESEDYGQGTFFHELFEELSAQWDPSFAPLRPEDVEYVETEREGFFAGLAVNWLAERTTSSVHARDCTQALVGALEVRDTTVRAILPLERAACHPAASTAFHSLQDRAIGHGDFLSVSLADLGVRRVHTLADMAAVEKGMAEGTYAADGDAAFGDGAGAGGGAGPPRNACARPCDGHACRAELRNIMFGDDVMGCARGSVSCEVGGYRLAQRVNRGELIAMGDSLLALRRLRAESPAGLAEWPRPSIHGIEDSADALCGEAGAAGADGGDDAGAADLCLLANYAAVLLRGLGFEQDDRKVAVHESLRGVHVDWTVGVALEHFAALQDGARGAAGGAALAAPAALAAARPLRVSAVAGCLVGIVVLLVTLGFVCRQFAALITAAKPSKLTKSALSKKLDLVQAGDSAEARARGIEESKGP